MTHHADIKNSGVNKFYTLIYLNASNWVWVDANGFIPLIRSYHLTRAFWEIQINIWKCKKHSNSYPLSCWALQNSTTSPVPFTHNDITQTPQNHTKQFKSKNIHATLHNAAPCNVWRVSSSATVEGLSTISVWCSVVCDGLAQKRCKELGLNLRQFSSNLLREKSL